MGETRIHVDTDGIKLFSNSFNEVNNHIEQILDNLGAAASDDVSGLLNDTANGCARCATSLSNTLDLIVRTEQVLMNKNPMAFTAWDSPEIDKGAYDWDKTADEDENSFQFFINNYGKPAIQAVGGVASCVALCAVALSSPELIPLLLPLFALALNDVASGGETLWNKVFEGKDGEEVDYIESLINKYTEGLSDAERDRVFIFYDAATMMYGIVIPGGSNPSKIIKVFDKTSNAIGTVSGVSDITSYSAQYYKDNIPEECKYDVEVIDYDSSAFDDKTVDDINSYNDMHK